MVKDIKPPALARQVRSLQKQLKLASELRESQNHQHAKYRDHAAQKLAEHLGKIRRLSNEVESYRDNAVRYAFQLNDNRDRLAIQYRMVAEAKDDATQALRNRQDLVQKIHESSGIIHELEERNKQLQENVQYLGGIARGSIWSFIKRRIFSAWRDHVIADDL